jgi:hypothetical protein
LIGVSLPDLDVGIPRVEPDLVVAGGEAFDDQVFACPQGGTISEFDAVPRPTQFL